MHRQYASGCTLSAITSEPETSRFLNFIFFAYAIKKQIVRKFLKSALLIVKTAL